VEHVLFFVAYHLAVGLLIAIEHMNLRSDSENCVLRVVLDPTTEFVCRTIRFRPQTHVYELYCSARTRVFAASVCNLS
jgi:hypothetical protein